MTRYLTLNQFVNTWECDENDHLNVQYYYSKFDDAAQLFLALHGLELALGQRRSRLVRYHSEMRSGEQLRILSSLVTAGQDDLATGLDGAAGQWVQHIMVEPQSGRLCATALDHYDGDVGDRSVYEIGDGLDPRVVARSLKSPPDFEPKDLAARREGGYIMTSRGILHPSLCSANGMARDQAYVGAVSDAAAHAWEAAGLNSVWLMERSLGRIAVEMRLVVLRPMPAGAAYEMQTGFNSLHSRSFSKRYDFFDIRSGEHYGYVEDTAMILNHQTRRSEPLPDFARIAISEKLVE